ncbi:class I SAM-dependent methyltransferase [Acetobacteraceae bacterium KSS8]|uniref:Class I SAM-dependent methyltransferase n=1 Tax=Endosaccharibacter trunci TaxID=2812733 RepID=A0ABT1W7R7_9PROT|nr:class I SAM-dependent methyltransferase [Acetobacteraceae bacterium KSS8]
MPDPVDGRDDSLRAQYESFPYPERDPRDERKRLFVGSPSHLREIDHWCFGALRPQSAPLRALVAGCGTGDAGIMLATQLEQAGRPGHVLCIDRSEAALRIARARAEVRGLSNIAFEQRSLLDLPADDLAPFDYIDCCGVLHHLPDPAATLRGLERSLAPGGAMGLMVYAPHGRTGVYMMQDALALLAPPEEAPRDRLDVARRVMRHLPATAWLRANTNFGDHVEGGDAGLYDLLLNPRDRAYTIDAFLRLLDGAGLEAAALMEPARYDPDLLLPDPRLRVRAQALGETERALLAEHLAGNMNTHVLYAVRRGEAPPAPDATAPDAVPVAREMPAEIVADQIGPDGTLPMPFGRLVVPVPLPALAQPILRLIDGERMVGAILSALEERGIARPKAETAWAETWRALSRCNRILLRAPR